MTCKYCRREVGEVHFLYSPVTCTSCGQWNEIQGEMAEYLEFYAETVHRYWFSNPITCRNCGHEISIALYVCKDKQEAQDG